MNTIAIESLPVELQEKGIVMTHSIKVEVYNEDAFVVPVVDITGFDSIADMESDLQYALETIRNGDC